MYGSIERKSRKRLFMTSQRKPFVDILTLLFGIGAWISINGVWVELPLLVQELPEGWNLPSYMSVVIQIANIGPLLYSACRLFRPSLNAVFIIYGVLFVGCLASVFLAINWDRTTVINGVDHSTWLLVLLFFLALVDCTSSVLYIPYMASWKSIYLSSYLCGEGLSGLLPAVVALAQGAGGNGSCQNITTDGGTTWVSVPEPPQPNFSISSFFYFLFGMMLLSSLSFFLLETLPFISSERSLNSESSATLSQVSNVAASASSESQIAVGMRMSNKTFWWFCSLIIWSSFLVNGLLPSIQSYSCASYGVKTYHFATILSSSANPIAALSTMKLRRSSAMKINSLAVVGTGLACYILATALLSPNPPLVNEISGSIIIVTAWILFVGIITYLRVEISNQVREEGERPLFWVGAATQGGSAIGALIAFVLVNFANIFTAYQPC